MTETTDKDINQLIKNGHKVKSFKKKKKKKWRFTEKIIFIVLIYTITVFERGLIYAFINYSESMWGYLLPAIGVLASSAFAVFVWKEKNENIPKILENPNYDSEQLKQEMRYELEEEFRNLGKY